MSKRGRRHRKAIAFYPLTNPRAFVVIFEKQVHFHYLISTNMAVLKIHPYYTIYINTFFDSYQGTVTSSVRHS